MKSLGTLILAVSFFLAAPLTAQGPQSTLPNRVLGVGPGPDRCGCAGGKDSLIKELNFSKEQQSALRSFHDRRQQMAKQMLRAKLEKLELNDLLRAPTVNEQAVKAQLGKLNQAVAEINNGRVENLLVLKKALTPEQYQRLMAHIEEGLGGEHGKKWGKKWGSHHSKKMRGPDRDDDEESDDDEM